MTIQEFQAVILAAGRGSRMSDLTSSRPKCLLPVGGLPILRHSINIFEKAGFQDVIVVVLQSALSEIEEVINDFNFNIHIELFPIQEQVEEGTAESIKCLLSQDKLKTDVIIASCDLYTDENLGASIETFRKHNASFVALFYPPYDGLTQFVPEIIPGPKSKYKPEKDIIGIDTETSRLIFLASASDFEEFVPISKRLLQRHKKVKLRTDLLDGHLYIVSLAAIKTLLDNKVFSSLKGEFLPSIVKKQYVTPAESNKNVKSTETNFATISTFTDHTGDLKDPYLGDSVRCFAVLADSGKFGVRANSVQALCLANLLSSHQEYISKKGESLIDKTATVQSTQISESFIAKKCNISEKTCIKNSTVGANSKVSPKTRILQCIIMSNVEIGEGCVLQNCIICDKAKISEKCELKDCIVGASHVVPASSKHTAQILTKSDQFMEI